MCDDKIAECKVLNVKYFWENFTQKSSTLTLRICVYVCLYIYKSRLEGNLRRRFRNRQYPVHRWSVASSAWCPGSRYTSSPAIWTACRTSPSTWRLRNRLPGPCYDPGWRTRYRPWSLASASSCKDRHSRSPAAWPRDHLPKVRNMISFSQCSFSLKRNETDNTASWRKQIFTNFSLKKISYAFTYRYLSSWTIEKKHLKECLKDVLNYRNCFRIFWG